MRAAYAALTKILLFNDLQNIHGASLNTDATSNALGNGSAFLMYHDLHGADLNTLATLDAQLLVDHVNAGLCVLSDGAMLTSLHALAALDANHGLGIAVLTGNDLDAGVDGIRLLIESLGTSLSALQASHTFGIFLNSELLHSREISFYIIFYDIIPHSDKNSNDEMRKFIIYFTIPPVNCQAKIRQNAHNSTELKQKGGKTMKKFAILALSGILAASILTGCRRNVGTETTAPTSKPTQPTTASTMPTQPTTMPTTAPTQAPSKPTEPTGTTDSTGASGDQARRPHSRSRN